MNSEILLFEPFLKKHCKRCISFADKYAHGRSFQIKFLIDYKSGRHSTHTLRGVLGLETRLIVCTNRSIFANWVRFLIPKVRLTPFVAIPRTAPLSDIPHLCHATLCANCAENLRICKESDEEIPNCFLWLASCILCPRQGRSKAWRVTMAEVVHDED